MTAYQVLVEKVFPKNKLYEILRDSIENPNASKMVTFLNPYSFSIFDGNLRLMSNFDYFFIDGMLLKWFFNMRNSSAIDRVSFDYSSIAADVFNFCRANNLSIALIGGTDNENKLAGDRISSRFPGIELAYLRSGFFESDSEKVVFVEELKAAKPDVLIFGMGTPMQEKMLLEYRDLGGIFRLGFTCGGFISQTALKDDYYWWIVKRLNLRFLQRFILHSHVRKRLMIDYPKFIFNFMIDWLRR